LTARNRATYFAIVYFFIWVMVRRVVTQLACPSAEEGQK
jgi:hypothetical protein